MFSLEKMFSISKRSAALSFSFFFFLPALSPFAVSPFYSGILLLFFFPPLPFVAGKKKLFLSVNNSITEPVGMRGRSVENETADSMQFVYEKVCVSTVFQCAFDNS